MSDHEASAKASAHLAVIAKPTRVTCRDLPARSKLNDLVRLRAAIITSRIYGARTESFTKPSRVNFFGSRAGHGDSGFHTISSPEKAPLLATS